ncbi:HAD family hydrolase [Streptomyces sp. NPDC059002]|uniref:HAD family hydrolase n=1 Tax=Streptomyces sp. NPDC059002 TaxID=3346690 RepID=UPI003680B634
MSGANGALPRALVWDMDGTLLDSGEVVPDAFVETVRRLGGPSPGRAEVVALYALGPPRIMLSRLLQRPCAEDDLDLYHAVLADTAAGAVVYPGIRDTLDALHGSVPLAVFTGASRRAAQILLSATGLADRFDAVVGGDEVDRQKPDPEGVLSACLRIGVRAHDTVYTGDAPRDLLAARAAGARAAAAGWGHQYDPGAPADLTLRTPLDLLPVFGRPAGAAPGPEPS